MSRVDEFQGAMSTTGQAPTPAPIGGRMGQDRPNRVLPGSADNFGLKRLTAWEAPQGASTGAVNTGTFYNRDKM